MTGFVRIVLNYYLELVISTKGYLDILYYILTIVVDEIH